MKSAMEAYLERRGDPKVRSLFDAIAFDPQNRERELGIFGQEWFEKSQVTLGMQSPRATSRRARCASRSRATGCSTADPEASPRRVRRRDRRPAVADRSDRRRPFTAGPNSSVLPAVAGYPHVTVPAGWYHGLPVGLSFFGRRVLRGQAARLRLRLRAGDASPPAAALFRYGTGVTSRRFSRRAC